MAEGFDTEQANSSPSTPVQFGETHGDAIQESYMDLDKSGHTEVFSDTPELHLFAPNFMRCRYESEKPTDSISSDEKKVRFILQKIDFAGTAHVLIYTMDIGRNALHPVKLVGDNCEKDVYCKTMKLHPGRKIDKKIGLSPVLPKNKDIPKNIEDRVKYLRERLKATLPVAENSSRKGKIDKNLFCLKVEVQCSNGMTLVGYSNPVRDGKDGMEFKVYKYSENLLHTEGLVTMTENSNFDDNIDDMVVLLKKKGSAENEEPIEVFKALEIENKAITIKPISDYLKERYPKPEWCHFQIQVKDCVTGLETVPHDLYGTTVSSASPCTPAKKIKIEHGINKEQEHKGQSCSDQARKAIHQKVCKSGAVKSQIASEQVESSLDQQLTLPTNIPIQAPKHDRGIQSNPIFHCQADLRSSVSQTEASAVSLNALSAVEKKKVIQRGVKETREYTDIKLDKICTSVDGQPNCMVQTKDFVVTSFNPSLQCDKDTSSWDSELMQMNWSQTCPHVQYGLEDYPMQQDTCQKPDQAMDAHDDDDHVVQQDNGQITDQTVDNQEDDVMQHDSGHKSDRPMDAHENDDVMQQDSSHKSDWPMDAHEDDAVQLDSGQDPDQTIDDDKNDALQHNNEDNEHDAIQLNCGPKPNQGVSANDDALQQYDDQNQNEAREDMQEDAMSPTERLAAIKNLIECSVIISDDNIMDPNQKSPLTFFEDNMR